MRLKYAIVTLIAFLIIGAVVFFVTDNGLKNFILDSDKSRISSQIQNHANGTLDLEHPTSLKVDQKYISFIQSITIDESLKNIQLADPNGEIIFSYKPSDVGENVLSSTNVKQALSGSASLSNVDLDASTGQITIPIKNSNNAVRAVVIATAPLSSDLKNINATVAKMAGIAGLVSLIFVVILYYVFANAENTLLAQQNSIIDKSKALQEEQQLDEAIMSSVAESLVVINSHGQIMVFNKEAEKLTGVKANDVEYRLYRKILRLVDKDGKEISPNPITDALNEGKIIKKNIADGIFLKNSKKELIPISIGLAPIFEKGSRVSGVVATISDISAEKELDKVKDEFVYVVAHELGNPIFALDGYLSVLEDKLKNSSQKNQEILHSARSVNSQLSNLVNDLLEAVRNENGQLVFDTEQIDITSITKEVVDSASFKAKNKKISISYGPSKQPKLLGNSAKIKEVITNFVDNAIKYTPEGGHIDIWHDREEDMIATNVKDNGYGMNDEEQKNLFEKFYRVKNTNTKGIPGTGLGLFICRQIVEKCDGKVWAQSEEGNGSTFSFSLKISKK